MNEMTDREVVQHILQGMADKNQFIIPNPSAFYRLYVNIVQGKVMVSPQWLVADCYGLFFSHDFAKALWGEGLGFQGTAIEDLPPDHPQQYFKTKDLCTLLWRYHLQMMVMFENPIDYLRKFVEA